MPPHSLEDLSGDFSDFRREFTRFRNDTTEQIESIQDDLYGSDRRQGLSDEMRGIQSQMRQLYWGVFGVLMVNLGTVILIVVKGGL